METLLQEQNCIQVAKNVFGKFQKHFLLSRRKFCVFNMCCVGSQMREHFGDTEDTLTLNVSRIMTRLHTLARYVDVVKCFASMPFAHRCNIVSNIDTKCRFLQQRFLICTLTINSKCCEYIRKGKQHCLCCQFPSYCHN